MDKKALETLALDLALLILQTDLYIERSDIKQKVDDFDRLNLGESMRIVVVDVLEENRRHMNCLRRDNDEGLNNEPPEELSESYLHMVETSTPI